MLSRGYECPKLSTCVASPPYPLFSYIKPFHFSSSHSTCLCTSMSKMYRSSKPSQRSPSPPKETRKHARKKPPRRAETPSSWGDPPPKPHDPPLQFSDDDDSLTISDECAEAHLEEERLTEWVKKHGRESPNSNAQPSLPAHGASSIAPPLRWYSEPKPYDLVYSRALRTVPSYDDVLPPWGCPVESPPPPSTSTYRSSRQPQHRSSHEAKRSNPRETQSTSTRVSEDPSWYCEDGDSYGIPVGAHVSEEANQKANPS